MEMGGEVYLKCEKTGYRADLEFKLKVLNFIGYMDYSNPRFHSLPLSGISQ